MRKILIVGGGYAGLYTAKKLEKWLRRGEADVTMVDPLPYMTYQPFLPEVAAGTVEPRHAVVGHRRHLKRTKVITAKVTNIDHANKKATITPEVGEPWDVDYDIVVVTAGAVSRTFPIPGVADDAIGLKNIEEAIAIRDQITDNFIKASNLPHGPERDRLLTFVVVGGGFAGIEVFGEMRSFASALVASVPHHRLRRHALPPHRGDGPHHARGVAQDQPLGAQEPRPARRRGAPRHAAHERRRRQHRALDRRDLPVRRHRLDRGRHGQPRSSATPTCRSRSAAV